MRDLATLAQKKTCIVYILSLLERINKPDYNNRARDANEKLADVFRDMDNVHFIRTDSYINAEVKHLYTVTMEFTSMTEDVRPWSK